MFMYVMFDKEFVLFKFVIILDIFSPLVKGADSDL